MIETFCHLRRGAALAVFVSTSLLVGSATPAIAQGATPALEVGLDNEISELLSNMAHDLSRIKSREREQLEKMGVASQTQAVRPPAAQRRVSIYSAPSALRLPIIGLTSSDLDDNFGAPREGGRRHRGIDIFAPRGAQVVAVTDGYISYIGEQGKGGRCLWLVTDSGTSFYYAHLDRWAPGLYEGMEVSSGSLLGFVGTTGNAVHTPPHLHFQVVDNDEAVNPYPLLKRSTVAVRGSGTRLGHGFGK
ncbi:MAG TPA: M23 family metallopeptidase [Thermoanaerobaculia bacterium]|nr:M23 family metallopeptidase [Thermoanaerobaculia bacterium]